MLLVKVLLDVKVTGWWLIFLYWWLTEVNSFFLVLES